MNDFDLEKKLKEARIPGRGEDYWEAFPRSVMARLRATPARHRAPERQWLSMLAWGGGVAVTCLIIGFAFGDWHAGMAKNDTHALLQNRKMLREVFTLFPNHVRAIVQDEHGVQLVLSDQADVPASSPIYVQICDGKRCSSLVTFSGQELEINGSKVTILSDAKGGVIVAGPRFAWSSERPGIPGNGLKIEARSLDTIVL